MSSIYSTRKQRRHTRRFAKLKSNALVLAVQSIVPAGASIVDLGAGFGGFVRSLVDVGYNAFGVDGSPEIEEISGGVVRRYDLTKDCSSLYGKVDWATFFEVGEHVPSADERKLLDQVCAIPAVGIIVTWAGTADVGKTRGHVNPHDEQYVKRLFSSRGWVFNETLTRRVRLAAGNHLARLRRLLVFRRRTRIKA